MAWRPALRVALPIEIASISNDSTYIHETDIIPTY